MVKPRKAPPTPVTERLKAERLQALAQGLTEQDFQLAARLELAA